MIQHDDDVNTEYRYVLTNKDLSRIERLMALLSDAIYDLFAARELPGDLTIDDTPGFNETRFYEKLHELQKGIRETNQMF